MSCRHVSLTSWVELMFLSDDEEKHRGPKRYVLNEEARVRGLFTLRKARLVCHSPLAGVSMCSQCARHQHLPISPVHSRPLCMYGQLNPAKPPLLETGYDNTAARVARPDFSFSFHSRSLGQSESHTQSPSFGLSATSLSLRASQKVNTTYEGPVKVMRMSKNGDRF
jgi:hypothetical protein